MKNAPWLNEAMKDLGLREIKGGKHNPRVLEMFEQSGHGWVKDDETAWCSAAANAWTLQAGVKGTGSLAARSWMKWGKSLKKKVKPGAIAVFKRGNKSWQGHVAICTGKETRTTVEVIGGNQRNAVNIKKYPKSKLLDTRWPSTFGNSRTVKAQMGALGSSAVGAVSTTATELLPVAQDATQWISWAGYVAFGLSAVLAVCTIAYRMQDQEEKGL